MHVGKCSANDVGAPVVGGVVHDDDLAGNTTVLVLGGDGVQATSELRRYVVVHHNRRALRAIHGSP